MVESLRAGVIVTRPHPGYKDVPGVRYHYPRKAYQRTLESLVGALVLTYEPRRGGTSETSAGGGRSMFTGSAFIKELRDDPDSADHGYAELRYTIDFNTPVPIADTAVSGKALQSAVLPIPYEEAARIFRLGLSVERSIEGLADVEALQDLQVRPIEQIIQNVRVRDASFRYRVVEKVYQGRCALTGVRMTNGNGRAEADAAHLRPVANDGSDTVRNGIALMKSLHWAFDRGLVSLSDEGQILTVDRGLDESVIRLLRPDGYALLPASVHDRPHPTFLQWHRSHVFKGAA